MSKSNTLIKSINHPQTDFYSLHLSYFFIYRVKKEITNFIYKDPNTI